MAPIVIGIGMLPLCGCSVAPRGTVAVPLELPAAYSGSGVELLPDKWWESFEDPALNTQIETGLAQNFSIRTAWDRLNQAEQAAVRAGAELLPDAAYQASARRTRRDVNNDVSYSSTYTAGIAASYEVDLWKRVRSVTEAAALDARAAQEDVAAAAITLSAAIAKVWYQLIESGLQEQLIAGQVDTNERVLTIITLQFRQGQVGASNVFRQRQFVEATRGQLIAAQERTVLLRHQLAILLGKAPGSWKPEGAITLVTLPELPAAGVPSDLLLRRPDLRSAGIDIAAADARVYAAVAEQYPRISLFADADTSSSRIGDLFDDWAASLAANAVGPLFDGGFRRAEAELRRAVLSERIHSYGQQTLIAIGEVEDALQQEYYQRQTIANVHQQLELAQQVYDRTRESYLKGQLDYLRVLDALVSRQALERNELTAQRVLIEHRIDLCRSIAGGWAMPRPDPATLEPDPHLSMRMIHD
jgi:NodT family efflux transporter outer membrane factor (OMF) lipoprotein